MTLLPLDSLSSNTDAVNATQAALSDIEKLLTSDPALAEAQAAELLAAVPGHPMALLFQGIAHRLMGNPAAAIELLTPLCQRWPDAPAAHLQLGLALREAGQNVAAVRSMRRAVAINPEFSDAWLALADLLHTMEDRDGADAAFTEYARTSGHDPDLAKAAAALQDNRTAEAEPVLRKRIQSHPTDIAAMCLLAGVLARHGLLDNAGTLLTRCLELAPGYRAARRNYAVLLLWQNRPQEALKECDRLLATAPEDPGVRSVKANVLRHLGEYEECVNIYENLLDGHSDQPKVWTSLGHALRTIGRVNQCVSAYRKAIALAPHFGEAYWSLANLKTPQFTDSDLESMQTQLEKSDLEDEERVHFHFAIAKALEDRGEFADSFRHYADGNRLRHDSVRYDPAEITDLVRRSMELFSPAFFAERMGCGASASDPVFIVGLPRVGSTLVEQILASHSAVEGTTELPDIATIVKSLAERGTGSGKGTYPEVLASMKPDEFRDLGQSYIEQTRVQRKRGTPFFIDKMPNNFACVGLIHLILPNARIIDVRRHPLATGWSLFRHLFARGQNFGYSLEDIGRYYRDYVQLMAHFDAVLPGRVHRVIYESLVKDTEGEVRRLLEYCGLPFEEACLNFHDNKRAVNTPSSEQVRSPIYLEAIDHWRHYEPWLDPLKAALGPLVDAYPAVPEFSGTED